LTKINSCTEGTNKIYNAATTNDSERKRTVIEKDERWGASSS